MYREGREYIPREEELPKDRSTVFVKNEAGGIEQWSLSFLGPDFVTLVKLDETSNTIRKEISRKEYDEATASERSKAYGLLVDLKKEAEGELKEYRTKENIERAQARVRAIDLQFEAVAEGNYEVAKEFLFNELRERSVYILSQFFTEKKYFEIEVAFIGKKSAVELESWLKELCFKFEAVLGTWHKKALERQDKFIKSGKRTRRPIGRSHFFGRVDEAKEQLRGFKERAQEILSIIKEFDRAGGKSDSS